jgi:hypothetical protein
VLLEARVQIRISGVQIRISSLQFVKIIDVHIVLSYKLLNFHFVLINKSDKPNLCQSGKPLKTNQFCLPIIYKKCKIEGIDFYSSVHGAQ